MIQITNKTWLPLRASVAGLGGGISWRRPAYSLLGFEIITTVVKLLLFVSVCSDVAGSTFAAEENNQFQPLREREKLCVSDRRER